MARMFTLNAGDVQRLRTSLLQSRAFSADGLDFGGVLGDEGPPLDNPPNTQMRWFYVNETEDDVYYWNVRLQAWRSLIL